MKFSKRVFGLVQHSLYQGDELVFLERLLDEIHRAFFHRIHRHGYIAVTRDEHDGQRRADFDQPALQLQASHPAHADVCDQAGDFTRVVAAEKRFS